MNSRSTRVDDVSVTLDQGVSTNAFLALPDEPKGLVIFAHGSGSGRNSPRNRFVADALNTAGLATLLLDLLTPQEEALDRRTAELRFDISLLARRLIGATDWVRSQPALNDYRLAYFGASTGAAAALVAAAIVPGEIFAVVSRGGRPDLAGQYLARVHAPTLLVVGGNDREVLALNRRASARMTADRQIVVVPGATHLFEEPGALEEVARLSRYWFVQHLGKSES
jgi:putative phosphoribosyl transferase